MLIRKVELVNLHNDKKIDVDVASIDAKDNLYLRRLEDIKGHIDFIIDYDNKVKIDYALTGIMICPDSITLKDCPVDFEIADQEEICFDEFEEGFFIYGDMELEELILTIVLPEVPIKVENNDKTMYHIGDNWSFLSEEEYAKGQKNKLDPRLQILKDYKEE